MTAATKPKTRRDIGELIRDGVGIAGTLALAIGAGLQFGLGYGLMTSGAICIALVILGSVRK